jgi:hypothetical protein
VLPSEGVSESESFRTPAFLFMAEVPSKYRTGIFRVQYSYSGRAFAQENI